MLPSSPPQQPSSMIMSLSTPSLTSNFPKNHNHSAAADQSQSPSPPSSSSPSLLHTMHQQQQQQSPQLSNFLQNPSSIDLHEVLHRINTLKVPHSTVMSRGGASDEIETVPSGPRHPGQGCEEMDQAIMLAESSRTGGARLRITLLAAGFIIGPSGSSINAISTLTGADIRSRTLHADQLCLRDTREFSVEGRPLAVVHALSIMCDAVDKYKSLTEGEYAGKIVSHVQHVSGVDFFYQPPPRSKMPQAASLKGNAKKHLLAKEQKLRAHQQQQQGLPPRAPTTNTTTINNNNTIATSTAFKKQQHHGSLPLQYHLGFNQLQHHNHHATTSPYFVQLDLLRSHASNPSISHTSSSNNLSINNAFADAVSSSASSASTLSYNNNNNNNNGTPTNSSSCGSSVYNMPMTTATASSSSHFNHPALPRTPSGISTASSSTAYAHSGMQATSPPTPPPLYYQVKEPSMTMMRAYSCPDGVIDGGGDDDDVLGSLSSLLYNADKGTTTNNSSMDASACTTTTTNNNTMGMDVHTNDGTVDAVHAAICAPAMRRAMHAMRSSSNGISLGDVSSSLLLHGDDGSIGGIGVVNNNSGRDSINSDYNNGGIDGGNNTNTNNNNNTNDNTNTNMFKSSMHYGSQSAQNQFNNSLILASAAAQSLDSSLLSFQQAQQAQHDAQEHLLAQLSQQLNASMMFSRASPPSSSTTTTTEAHMQQQQHGHEMHAEEISAFAMAPARVMFNDGEKTTHEQQQELSSSISTLYQQQQQQQQLYHQSVPSTPSTTTTWSVPMTPAPSLSQENDLITKQPHYQSNTTTSISNNMMQLKAPTFDRAFSDQSFYSAFSDVVHSMHSMHLDSGSQKEAVIEPQQQQDGRLSNAWSLNRGESLHSASSWDMGRAIHAVVAQNATSGVESGHQSGGSGSGNNTNNNASKNIWSLE